MMVTLNTLGKFQPFEELIKNDAIGAIRMLARLGLRAGYPAAQQPSLPTTQHGGGGPASGKPGGISPCGLSRGGQCHYDNLLYRGLGLTTQTIIPNDPLTPWTDCGNHWHIAAKNPNVDFLDFL
ncbi:hypothetical protein BDV12DRAFT_201629 [Aspergillus spectabilis]